MKKYNYRWIWTDQDNTYKNLSYSLENIIKEIVEYYYSGDVMFFFVNRKENDETGDTFHIHFVVADQTYEYECGANPDDVAEFLNELAEECDRPDSFDIENL